MQVTESKVRVCPKCGKEYKGHPAISRVDNTTPICPECGTREALENMGVPNEEIDKIISIIPTEVPNGRDN